LNTSNPPAKYHAKYTVTGLQNTTAALPLPEKLHLQQQMRFDPYYLMASLTHAVGR